MRSLLTRLKRLENVQAAERWPQIELQIGYLKKLPPEYVGERHVVTVGQLPDGKYHWEERPGPAPAIEDDGDARTIIRISAVKLIDDLAGESPASADYPVGTVVIFGDGAGDQAVGSPDVNALDGWT